MSTTTKTPASEGFVLIRREIYEYNAAHQVIRTTHANGKTVTTDWICKGPLSVTDENGIQTLYLYNSAKKETGIIHESTPLCCDICPDTEIENPPLREEFTHNGVGILVQRKTSQGEFTRINHYEYDFLGRICKEISPSGLETTYGYSADGLTETKNLPTGATLVTRKDSSGLILEESGTGRQAKFYEYGISPSGLVSRARINSPDGPVIFEQTVNGLGQLVEERTRGDNDAWLTTTYHYNDKGRVKQIDSTQKPTTFLEYDSLGNLCRETIAFSLFQPGVELSDKIKEWDYYYESKPAHWSARQTSQPFHTTVQRIFTEQGSPLETSESQLAGDSLDDSTVSAKVSVDKYGNSSWTRTENFQGNFLVTEESFGKEKRSLSLDGNLIYEWFADGSSYKYVRAYEAGGATLTRISSGGIWETTKYDTEGREHLVEDQTGLRRINEYAPSTGLLSSRTYENGSWARFRYDHRGNLLSTWGTASYPLKCEYDEANRVIARHTFRSGEIEDDPFSRIDGDITRIVYDPLSGRQLQKIFPDNTSNIWVYDDTGQLLHTIDAAGLTTTYQYSPYSKSPSDITYSDQTPSIHYTFNHLGQKTSVSDESETRTVLYSEEGDPVMEIVEGSVSYQIRYSRDKQGRSTGHELLWNGQVIQKQETTLDALGRIASLETDSLRPAIFKYHDSERPLLSQIIYPSGITKDFNWHEEKDVLCSLAYHDSSGNGIASHSVAYNAMGRIDASTHTVGGETRETRYSYTTRGELSSATRLGSCPAGDLASAYDGIGNRTTITRDGQTYDYETNSLNQYTEIQSDEENFSPDYDANGNQIRIQSSTGLWNVVYNSRNRPVVFTQGSKTVRYSYDYLGRRTEKTVCDQGIVISRKFYAYQGHQLLAEWDLMVDANSPDASPAQARLRQSYYWLPLEGAHTLPYMMAVWDGYGGREHYSLLHSVTKNTSAIISGDGCTVAEYDYDVFGRLLSSSGSLSEQNPFRFSAEYFDDDLGLVCYAYRLYNPLDGRWTSREPIGEIHGLNLYAFAGNSPADTIDLLGLATIDMYIHRDVSTPFGVYGRLYIDSTDPKIRKCCGLPKYIRTMESPPYKGNKGGLPVVLLPKGKYRPKLRPENSFSSANPSDQAIKDGRGVTSLKFWLKKRQLWGGFEDIDLKQLITDYYGGKLPSNYEFLIGRELALNGANSDDGRNGHPGPDPTYSLGCILFGSLFVNVNVTIGNYTDRFQRFTNQGVKKGIEYSIPGFGEADTLIQTYVVYDLIQTATQNGASVTLNIMNNAPNVDYYTMETINQINSVDRKSFSNSLSEGLNLNFSYHKLNDPLLKEMLKYGK